MDNCQTQIMEILCGVEPVTLSRLETEALVILQKTVLSLMGAYAEELTANIRLDKKGRRQASLVLERKGDKRSVLTKVGMFEYSRDYYYDRSQRRYHYPVDEILGVASGQRISTEVGLSLASAAAEMSYEKSCRYVTEGEVSRQTVLIKVRDSQPKAIKPMDKRRVAALHVDADEDHVTLVGGKKSIVPLISVYEGIGQTGKRRYCKNVFHISEYGLDADVIWEKALSEIEERYELEGTTIYLHGDGGSWIKRGQEWLPNCRFVLDKYHKNKTIKAMCAGLISKRLRRDTESAIRERLRQGDEEFIGHIANSLCLETPWRKNIILESAQYLQNYIGGIRICEVDAEANNGGCSEPHVSHVLSSRLSDRPRVWSKATLASLAPILAARGELEVRAKPPSQLAPMLVEAAAKASGALKPKNPLGLVDPDSSGTLTAIALGKRNPTFKAVYSFMI